MFPFETLKCNPMSTTAAIKAQRGTKRMCQNPQCGSRFYDLNRNPITCPICNSVYEVRVQAVSVAPSRPAPRPAKKPAPFVPDQVKPDVPAEEVPIAAVTNGVHAPTWISPEMDDALARYVLPDWDDATPADWLAFLTMADRHFKERRAKSGAG